MAHTAEADVVIGGGGVAGLAAAAAIQQLGFSVVVIEPGLNDSRRLAGEVFHPPGVEGLADLGLLPALMCEPAVTVDGFSIWLDGESVRLPYAEVRAHRMAGLCLRHDSIRERLTTAVESRPNITVKRASRVVGIDQSDPSAVVVEVTNGRASSMHYRCRMLVAADGTPSRLARLAGIGVHNRRISTIVGYRIGTGNLPEAEFGHVYLGAETPILLYPIGGGLARVLFDIPYESGRRATAADCLSIAQVLPQALRREVENAIATQPRMSLLTQAITPERSVSGRVVLVGDAGGSCHPLTATGMTMCVSDALMLRSALQRRADDWPAALRLYERRRRWPQRTRLVLADVLREAFCAARPDLRVVRGGILRHLRASAAGRSAAIALMSTANARPLALLRQFATVMVCGFIGHLRDPLPDGRHVGRLQVAGALIAGLTGHLRDVLRGRRIAETGRARSLGPVSAEPAACAVLPEAGAAKASQPVQP